MNIKKQLSIILLGLFIFSGVFSPIAKAQVSSIPNSDDFKGSWWNPNYQDFLDKVNLSPPNEIFGERYTHAQVAWVLNSLISMLVGPVAACSDNPDPASCMVEHFTASSDAGLAMPLALLTDKMLQTRPVSSVDYVASKMERLGIVDSAYAQSSSTSRAGFGFTNSLTVAQPIWTISRDAAYSLVILMILILGFMIMFRAQVSARTVVTVQSALPRVFVGLILITFSYAIGGLLVDLTFLAQGLLAGIVTSQSFVDPGNTTAALDAFNQLNNVFGSVWALFLALLLSFFGVVLAGGASLLGAIVFGPASVFAGIVFILIFVLAILVALIRIFWVMLRTYATVVILVALSPFIFLYGIVKDGVNMMWFKMMIANLSVFFSVGALILMANLLIYTTASPSFITTVSDLVDALGGNGGVLDANPYNIQQVPNLNQTAIMPGFTSLGNTDIIAALVALAVFISIPKFANSGRDWISKGKVDFSPDSVGTAIGAGMGGGAAANYMVGRATRGAREEQDRTSTMARRLNRSVYDTGMAGDYRRRDAYINTMEGIKQLFRR